jgi:trafficking protein particle complex subunit 11
MSRLTVLVNTSFVFSAAEGHVGEAVHGQLKLFSEAHQNTSPVTFSKIRCQFKQNRYELEISHSSEDGTAITSQETGLATNAVEVIDLTRNRAAQTHENGPIVFKASANLTFRPGRRVIFIVAFDIKEPGELELETLISEIETSDFHLTFSSQPNHFIQPLEWYISGDSGAHYRKRITREEPWSVEIRPKPPKFDVQVLDLDRQLYTDEPVKVDFEIKNGEEEEVSATLDVRILTRGTPPEIAWVHSEESEPPSDSEGDAPSSRSLSLPSLSPDKSISRTAIFTAPPTPADLILEYKLHYFLPSDPEVLLSKTFTTNLSIILPFEANYEFTARVHPDPWPSYFSVSSPIPGLLQRWNLTASVASFASEPIMLQKVVLETEKKPSGLECNIIDGLIDDGREISPRTMRNYNFVFDTTRSSAKEHRTMSMSAKLVITWSRINSDSTPVTSFLLVSPLQLPPIEPRIIAMTTECDLELTPADLSSSADDESLSKPAISLRLLTLFMENPTAHPLTFDITVPSSDSLAFSGPKQQGVTILPYSRTEVDYRLLPLVKGGAWVTFGVKVVDRYFIREVEVLPGEGVKATEEGSGVRWWVD